MKGQTLTNAPQNYFAFLSFVVYKSSSPSLSLNSEYYSVSQNTTVAFEQPSQNSDSCYLHRIITDFIALLLPGSPLPLAINYSVAVAHSK